MYICQIDILTFKSSLCKVQIFKKYLAYLAIWNTWRKRSFLYENWKWVRVCRELKAQPSGRFILKGGGQKLSNLGVGHQATRSPDPNSSERGGAVCFNKKLQEQWRGFRGKTEGKGAKSLIHSKKNLFHLTLYNTLKGDAPSFSSGSPKL